ncbi:hypothetical protein J2Z21_008846 [Streptomyces griseochromogenes]|uniref:Uncharacterized protein n=1 Tax=Streptomyces griseochromogenes TaxID=68214 RepID=A0A1B1AZ05_9ACTN|nr:hypothetical protein AVL59_21295 [Streptomyces griseochromogenes]MBP2055830.1 hypothetical protein [Streptomyces griseochromogenes]
MDRSRSGAEETDVSITPPKTWAVGVPAVASPLRYSLERTTVRRTALTPLDLDQTKGFDCPGCVWPEPDPAHRHRNEYCENGAKHVSNEAASGGEHDHAARLLERTTTRATGATATAPGSDGP